VSDEFVPIEERPCVYCGAEYDGGDFDHAEDCPTNTRLFLVRDQDVMCPCCKRCVECGDEFEVGDTYTHRKIAEGDGESFDTAPVYEIVCLGCAALDPEIETV
jgi:hypothetical protein